MPSKVALLSAHRNEGPFLLEFVAHHIAVGFSRIFLTTNPSDDGTVELAQALADSGHIEHLFLRTPFGQRPQEYAFRMARRRFPLDDFEWLMILDADELLNIQVFDGSISSYLESFAPTVDLISVNTACFGSYPYSFWCPTSSTLDFRYRLKSDHWRNSASKSLIHFPRNFSELRPHGATGFIPKRRLQIAFHGGLQVISADHDDPTIYRSLRRPGSSSDVHTIAQVNHYAVRTWDVFRLRAARGRGAAPEGTENLRHTVDYFKSFSRANFFDDSILRYSARFRDVLDGLLAIESVRVAQEYVLERHLRKIEALGFLP